MVKQHKHRSDKADYLRMTPEYLRDRADRTTAAGWPRPKWIGFIETLLMEGYEVQLYEARETVSKYVHIAKGARRYKVRFSNHKPNRGKELEGDCDFFVGVTHTGKRNTDMALAAVRQHFHNPNPEPRETMAGVAAIPQERPRRQVSI